ncbi:CcdB family protein [Caulobacter segnis]|uniref:CcdB family protein n=1 Tax=Caulobacter segnis TaxID=88688 RepID=UPI0024104770|nr:CcdB family protein [Caulobacter segnis]MDG2522771.1 CcdB family protein [Caulobacter segnis]
MRQFDVYRNPSPTAARIAPYLVILSSHHLHGLSEVVVAPAINDVSQMLGDLEIAVEIEGLHLTLAISELFSMTSAALKHRVSSLQTHEDAIRRALDRMFTGF